MAVVSLDLAARSAADNGLVVLRRSGAVIDCELVPLAERIEGRPSASSLADVLVALAEANGARLLLIDGPQGWKAPDSALVHQRLCEKALHTPGKTGLPGIVKPGTWSGFAELSVALFDELDARGWPRFAPSKGGRPDPRWAIESFPTAAWRSLGLRALPAKARARPPVVAEHLKRLAELVPLRWPRPPSHDELQAIVAGIAGCALEAGDPDGFEAHGESPFRLDGSWREGFILCPRIPGGAAAVASMRP